jgi:hypothetical protein
VDETAVLESVMAKYLALKHKGEESTYEITVSEIDGNSAKGMVLVTGEDGGGIWFGYKEEGAWRLLSDGNGVTECASFALYPEFSTKILPECYDTATESIVKR